MFTSTLKVLCESGENNPPSRCVCVIVSYNVCSLIGVTLYAVLSTGCALTFLDVYGSVLGCFGTAYLIIIFFATAYLIAWAQSIN